MTPAGGSCVLDDECAMGLYCAASHCTAGGTGTAGAGCSSDADCTTGLRCGLVGLGAECVAEGGGDVGATCTSNADCLGGIVCSGGTCGLPMPGMPFGPLWPGVTCNDAPGSVTAYFEVPRATGNGDFYRLPFPNDIRMVKGHPHVKDHPTPGAALLGYDVVARYLDAIEAENDGWGLYTTTFFRFSGEVDTNTLDNNVILVDLTTGKGLGLDYTISYGGGAYICPNWLGIRQLQGATYTEGHTYAAYVTTGVQAKGGAPIQRSADLIAVLAAKAPSDATLAAAYPAFAPLRDYLAKTSIDAGTILDATVFTVGHPTAPVTKLEGVVDGAPPPTAAMWTRCDTGVKTPCPDASGDRGCQAADPNFDELHALVSLPVFQQGKAPYVTPSDGGGLKLDGTGTPTVVGTQQVCMSLTVPKGTPPAGGWPTVVFAHGMGGDFQSHVTLGVALDFAKGVDDGTGNVIQAAVLGIDQVDTGPRRNGSTMASSDLFFNFANPAAAKGNVAQGAADQMSLLRFVPTVTFTAGSSPTGTAFGLATPAAFWGHSQGATVGSVALPFGTYRGAVLSGQGASLMDTLLGKTSPVNIAAALPFVLQDPGSNGKLNGGEDHPVLSLLQLYMDGSDPIAYASAAAATPRWASRPTTSSSPTASATPTRPITEATYALAAQLGLVAADASAKKPDPIGNLTPIPTPASGNLMVAGQPFTAVVREYAPLQGQDGQLVAFDVASARTDVERFLAGVLSGIVPKVGM